MKKTIFRALLTGVAFVIIFYGVQIIGGVYITEHYVPDITEQYASVDYLQSTVTISWEDNTSYLGVAAGIARHAVGVAAYYLVRLLKRKLSK